MIREKVEGEAITTLLSSGAGFVGDLLRDYFRFIVGGLVALGLLIHFTSLSLPTVEIGNTAKLILVFSALAAFGGFAFVEVFLDLDTEPDWRHLFEVNFNQSPMIRHHKLNPQAFDDLDVFGGALGHMIGHRYVCRYYDQDADLALVSWHNVKSDADLLGLSAGKIVREVNGIREAYESEIRKAEAQRDAIGPIIRRLSKDHIERKNQMIEQHTVPGMGDGRIDDLIEEMIPEDALHERHRSDDALPDDSGPETDRDDLGTQVDTLADALADDGPEAVADGGTDE